MVEIIFVDDIFRDEIAEARFCIFKTIKAIFKRAFDLEVYAPRFSPQNFFENIRQKYPDIEWANVYFELPEKIEKEYIKLLAPNAIYISYEAPIWLFKIWKKYKIRYIDLRLSYLRFLPDIPVMISTNIQSMIPVLKRFKVSDGDIEMEADLCKASYNFRHFRDWHNLRRLENSLIFLGQTQSDTSLMVEGQNNVVTIENFKNEIKKCFTRYEKIFYKPHPFAAPQHRNKELAYLSRLHGKQIEIVNENFYNLVAQDFPIDFLGLSSGGLKEAKYFGQKSLMLMDYPFEFAADETNIKYLNIEAYYFFSPKFWQECLEQELPIHDKCLHYRDVHQNIMREHHNASWSFNEFYYENRISVNDQLTAWGIISSAFFKTGLNQLFQNTEIIRNIFLYTQNKFKYWKYKLLSNITFGKKRKKYKQKRKDLKSRLKQVRRFLKGK